MNNKIILQRLEDLREVMRREKLDAFVFPSTDPHNSEYTPDHWKGREWISGFNGSAGTAVAHCARFASVSAPVSTAVAANAEAAQLRAHATEIPDVE